MRIKYLLWIPGSILFLILLLFILIQIPAVQDLAREKTVSWLQKKLQTKVRIDKLSINLRKLIVLKGIYFEDLNGDTLLAGDIIKVDVNLLKLLKNRVEINEIDMQGITAKVKRTLPDSTFNFDYILNAFMKAPDKNTQPDSSAGIKFSLDKIKLQRIDISFQDAVTANDISVNFNRFETSFRKFDLDKMKFSIPFIKLSGLNATIVQSKPAIKQETTAKVEADSNVPYDLDLKLGTIDLSQIRINYQNDISNLKTDLDLRQLLVVVNSIDLRKQRIALKSIELTDTRSEIVLGHSEQAKVVVEEVKKVAVATLNNDWRITVRDVGFKNIDLKYDDFNKPVQKRGMDYAHLGLKGFNLKAKSFAYSLDTISGSISEASFSNKDGFVLNALQTNFTYFNKGAILKDLYLETPGTTLRDYLQIGYPSLEALAFNPGIMTINTKIMNSRISFKDVITFAPQLADVDPFKNNQNVIVNISGNINGSIAKLRISDLQISGFRNTRISGSGFITGLPDAYRTDYNVNFREFTSGSADINQLLSPGLIPETLNLPEAFTLSGKFKGGFSDFETNLNMTSSFGAAQVVADLKNGKLKGKETFNATIELADFNAGHLLGQDSILGRISGHAQVTGSSSDPKTMNARFSMAGTSAEVKGYTYKNLVLDGNIADQQVTLVAKMDDQNFKFNLNAEANIQNPFPAVNFTLLIDTLNLKKINLVDADIGFSGKIEADLPSTNPDSLIGTLTASNLWVTASGKRNRLHNTNITATALGEQKSLHVQSDILTADLNGKYYLTTIGNAFTNEINKYFEIGESREIPAGKTQDFSFALNITSQPVLQEFIPLLTYLEPVHLKGSFNSEAGGLKMEVTTPKFTYAGTSVDHTHLVINSSGNTLNYNLSLDQISTTSLHINKTSVSGQAENNQVSIHLNLKDQSEKDKYLLSGMLSVADGQIQFSFKPEGILMNYDKWVIPPENLIEFGPKGIWARNFNLSRNGQVLSANSHPEQPNAPLTVDFKNFKISTLTGFTREDSLLANGTINGNVELGNLSTSAVFVGDLAIKDFSFKSDTVGDISLKVDNREANTYATHIVITGKGNDIVLDGQYFVRPENKSSFDLDLDVRNLNLATMEGFSMGNLEKASGNISGKLSITGMIDAPVVRGDLSFNKAAFNIVKLNSYYIVDHEKVTFSPGGISFDTFTLTDPAGNNAVIDGKVITGNFRDYQFGLHVTSKNFKVLNSTKKDNKLFWGEVFLNSDLLIRGDIQNPVVEGSVRINKGTDFSVVIPQDAPGVIEREGIVEFIDMDDPQTDIAFTPDLDTLNTSTITGMDISVNVDVDSSAVFNIIIDEGSGDFLEVQGDARLTAGIDKSGKVNLTGNFEVTRGAYELSFNFLKRRFIIEKGSRITWRGEPTTADVNITAIYIANAAPFDLVVSQLDEPPATLNRYKQRLPFEVTLNMKGELMKPEITFDISLPAHNYSVARDVVDNVEYQLAQLKLQTSELNKQVFALLLLNRFVAENPFISGAAGGGVESLARGSVSKILSEQLNQLAGSLIEGVDLNFDLISSDDYTTGSLQNRTDLNVGLSKQLLNDRLKVSIGSNFELEGPRNVDQKASNIAGNMALDYRLSADGRYMLRVYRKNEYQGIAEGYLTETGIGFIFTLDYKEFKELFARKKKEKLIDLPEKLP